jgi:Ca2+/Na+ antiporter
VSESTEPVADAAEGSQSASTPTSKSTSTSDGWLPSDAQELLARIRVAVYLLGSLLATSLLVVGTVAVIAEIKGTWHWAIHLESTISFMAIAIAVVLAALVPLLVALVVGRWWVHA